MTKTRMALENQTFGLLNTRPSPMGEQLASMCEQKKIPVLHQPMISTEPLNYENIESLSAALLKSQQLWIFVSRTAVNQFAHFIKSESLSFNPTSTVVAVGPGTKTQLITHFPELKTSVVCPEKANSESLIQLPELNDHAVNQVWLIKGQGGRELIKQHLKARNVLVNEVDLYRRVDVQYSEHDILNWFDYSIYLITSVDIGQALIKNMKKYLDTEQLQVEFNNKVWLVVSERIKTFLQQEKISASQIIICEQPDNSSIINNINRLAK